MCLDTWSHLQLELVRQHVNVIVEAYDRTPCGRHFVRPEDDEQPTWLGQRGIPGRGEQPTRLGHSHGAVSVSVVAMAICRAGCERRCSDARGINVKGLGTCKRGREHGDDVDDGRGRSRCVGGEQLRSSRGGRLLERRLSVAERRRDRNLDVFLDALLERRRDRNLERRRLHRRIDDAGSRWWWWLVGKKKWL